MHLIANLKKIFVLFIMLVFLIIVGVSTYHANSITIEPEPIVEITPEPDPEEVDTDMQSTVYAAINATSYALENLAINTDDPVPDYGTEYFISPNGKDDNPGTIDQPFATLEKARDTIHTLKTGSGLPSGGVVVWLRDGIYEISSTFNLASQDSGETDKPIAYRRYLNEVPRLVGGKIVDSSWFSSPANDDAFYSRLNTTARNNIYVADLNAHGITDYGTLRKSSYSGNQLYQGPMELYVDKKPADLARWPNKGSTTLLQTIEDDVLSVHGDTIPAVAGTYTKQSPKETAIIYKRNGLIDGKQYYFKKEEGTDNTPSYWTISNEAGIGYFGTVFDGFDLPKILDTNWNGSSGLPSLIQPDTEQFGFTFTSEGVSNKSFKYVGSKPENWASLNDVWVNGMLKYGWRNIHRKIFSIDNGAKTITLDSAPLYGIETGDKPKAYYYYNIPEELTVPGEYYVDRDRGKLYYYPNGDINSMELIVSMLKQAIVKIDGAQYIDFYGITLEAGRKELVYISGTSSNIKFSKCTLRNNGQNIAEIDGANNGFEYCEISGAGDHSIKISGGDRASLTESMNYIKNSHIHHGGRWNWYTNPIDIIGCGNIAENNDIHDFTAQAITFHGNEHSIQYNNIYNVMQFTEDAGAIYAGRDWGSRGNKIKYNFIHDIKNNYGERFVSGIYLDDSVSGNQVTDNIFYSIDGIGIFNNGGRDNAIENNLFDSVVTILGATNYGVYNINNIPDSQWNLLEKITPNHAKNPDNINYQSEPWRSRYPKLAVMPNNWTDVKNNGWLYPGGSRFTNNASSNFLRWIVQGYRNNDANLEHYTKWDSSPVSQNSPEFNPIPYSEIGIQAK